MTGQKGHSWNYSGAQELTAGTKTLVWKLGGLCSLTEASEIQLNTRSGYENSPIEDML